MISDDLWVKRTDAEGPPHLNPGQRVKRRDLNEAYLQSMNWSSLISSFKSADEKTCMALLNSYTDPDFGTVEYMHPSIFGAKANSEDTPNWTEAMNSPNADGFWNAMEIEIETLTKTRDCWKEVKRKPWMNVLPGTWAFKIKRFPDGSVKKLKARFCVCGDRQIEGVDFFDTFVPVVNWMTVRLMLIMSAILKLETRQVDYVAAFCQSPIEEDVYVDMPRGFAKEGTVLKLNKSWYGLKQSPQTFFKYLKGKLEQVGLQSCEEVDPCLFVSSKVICLVYVDDTLFFSPKVEYIDEIVNKLREADVDLEYEDDVAGFLGVLLDRDDETGTITMTETGLIDRIIKLLDVGSLPAVHTPAVPGTTLPSHLLDGDPPQATFSYKSAIGMLQYLSQHTRPDIQFAVSQVSRYGHNPKLQHEHAVIRIGQYLKRTRSQGLILRPDYSRPLDIDCYVDSDFVACLEARHHTIRQASRAELVL